MELSRQRTPELERLGSIISETNAGMLSTHDHQLNILRSRPLATLKMDDEPALWFLTSISSPKIKDLDEISDVCVIYVKGEDYVSVSGKSEIIRDRSVIKPLWSPLAKIWFPDGADDPDIAALKVAIRHAEYWDGPSSRLTQLFALAVAGVTGNDQALGDNVKLDV